MNDVSRIMHHPDISTSPAFALFLHRRIFHAPRLAASAVIFPDAAGFPDCRKTSPHGFRQQSRCLHHKPQGLSLNTNPMDPFIQKYGGAFPVEQIPDGLQVLEVGRPGHFVVAPEAPMTFEKFLELLKQVKLGTSNSIP